MTTYKSVKYNISGADLTGLTAGQIPNLATSKITTGTMADARISAGSVTQHVTAYDDNKLQSNVALLGFKTAVNGSLAKYNLQDQIIDEFVDATGVDASASTNESLTAGVYTGRSSTTSNNYFGDGSDGAVTTSGDVTHTVLNKSGSYDGDMVVKQYTDLVISSGDTMTTDQPCRGMIIYCTGDCTITGTLTMNQRGGGANPTASGGSDSNAVNAAGLQLGYFTSGGSSTFDNANTNFNGYGNAVRTVHANQPDMTASGSIFTITRTGGAAIASVGNGNQHGATGTAGTLAGTSMGAGAGGAGGIGSVHSVASDFPLGYSGAGGAFGGGSGATSVRYSGDPGAIGNVLFGGAGVTAVSSGGGNCASGGAGNPGGAGHTSGQTGNSGTGGIIILIVAGDLTITGTVSANGNHNTLSSNCAIGGAAGGGAIMMLYKGTLSNSGTVQSLGGAASSASGFGNGGAGGAGTTQLVQVATSGTSEAIDSLTLQSNDTTASTANPDYGDMVVLMEDAAGTATLNTDIKGYISEDSGVTFTQGTLVDEGTWGTNKKIIAFHDLDISAQTGSAMCYKITTHNQSAAKETKVHAASVGWR